MPTTLARLREQSVIYRVRFAAGQIVGDALPRTEKPPLPFEALQMPDAIAIVLGERGALRAPEITVALHDRGYRVDAQTKRLQDSVRAALKHCRDRFKCGNGGRWELSPAGSIGENG